MKECCKTGDEKPPNKFQVWLKRIIYAFVFLALAVAIFEQING